MFGRRLSDFVHQRYAAVVALVVLVALLVGSIWMWPELFNGRGLFGEPDMSDQTKRDAIREEFSAVNLVPALEQGLKEEVREQIGEMVEETGAVSDDERARARAQFLAQ
jgi:hypothetical protein